MEKIRDFIPKTYMPILLCSIIFGVFGFISLIGIALSNEESFESQLNEIKSLDNPKEYLIPDTLIIDSKETSSNGGSGQIFNIYIYGRLKSNPKIKKTFYESYLTVENYRNKYKKTYNIYECLGCNHDSLYVCECLPILRSNIHPNIYANNPYTLDGEITKIILDLIMETYLFWIVPFLYIYWKLTQLLYHYLNKKIDEKKR